MARETPPLPGACSAGLRSLRGSGKPRPGTMVLASLSPFTVLWYASFTDHDDATLFNAAMFAVASLSGQWVLRRHYKPLIARNPRHRWMLRLWLFIYAFVGIQMGWVLRPFLGHPNLPVSFFRAESWGNAYVQVAEMIGHALGVHH